MTLGLMADEPGDWKLKLRYGRLQTPYKHFSVLADGVAGKLSGGFECRPGRAWMTMSVWASSEEEAFDMARLIGKDIGFEVDGRMELFDTEPKEPPRDSPFAYAIGFTPYDEEAEEAP